MTESSHAPPIAATGRTAGRLLREARQAQGLHIAALAASIKVAQRKLEALEADRLDELPDATFTRALAQTVCRTLKIDSAPVLALLPQPAGHRLEHVSQGINLPFRDRPGQREHKDWAVLRLPGVWGAALLLLAAAVLYLLPQGWLPGRSSNPSTSVPALAGSAPASPAAGASDSAPAVVASAEPAAASGVGSAADAVAAPQEVSANTAAEPASGPLQLRATTAASWVEVQDARRQVLLSRRVQPGETVVIDGALPFRVKIGNAVATELTFRGEPVNLAPSTRDNVARLELK